MKEAKYWKPRNDGRIACLLCPHVCKLNDGDTGICNARKREGDKLFTLNYGKITSIGMDPIEKKPLYHFHPGSQILSAGTFGCNFKCPFCQNADISQTQPPYLREISPEAMVATAKKNESVGIAFTYNEPVIWMEFIRETAGLARQQNLKTVVVSNGYVNPEPLQDLLPLLDAANIDIKSIDESFYRKHCKARLQPVLETCVKMKDAGIHLEITNLVIPGENDSPENFAGLRDWVFEHLGPETPVHLSAYHPCYKFGAPPTTMDTMERAYGTVKEKMHYVYLGNVWTKDGSDTKCLNCGSTLVERSGYHIQVTGLSDANCTSCGTPAPFVV